MNQLKTPQAFVRRFDAVRARLLQVQIARALRRHKGKVTVFVPHYAMSGGTLIALAASTNSKTGASLNVVWKILFIIRFILSCVDCELS